MWESASWSARIVFWSKAEWATRWTKLVADGLSTVLSLVAPVGKALGASGKVLQFIEGPAGRATVNQIKTFLLGLAKATVASGDRIDAAARIIFDSNEPIDTPPIFNTLDAGVPQVTVDPPPVATLEEEFTVTWVGADDPQGSGLSHYTIYVSEDGGLLEPWLENTTLSQAPFTGRERHRYAFFSVAFDNAGNREALPIEAEAQILTPVLRA